MVGNRPIWVTSNQAEGLNYVLKELQEWPEAPIDCMVLTLNYLQSYYTLEVSRGKEGLGNYHMHSMFSNMQCSQPLNNNRREIKLLNE